MKHYTDGLNDNTTGLNWFFANLPSEFKEEELCTEEERVSILEEKVALLAEKLNVEFKEVKKHLELNEK